MKYYAILNKEEIYDTTDYGDNHLERFMNYWCIDFSKLTQLNLSSLYYNNDGTKAIVSYIGDKPDFLDGKEVYTNSEMVEEMKKAEWVQQ